VQLSSLGKVDEGDFQNDFESHTQTFTDEDLLELEKYRRQENTNTAYQSESPGHVLTVKHVHRLWPHFDSYCHWGRRRSERGSQLLGGTSDDELRVCIPRNPQRKKEGKNSCHITFFLQHDHRSTSSGKTAKRLHMLSLQRWRNVIIFCNLFRQYTTLTNKLVTV
jgi:hypothetical protein